MDAILKSLPSVGEQVSNFRIIEKLGGTMGVVYRAKDERLQRMVALKFLSPDRARDKEGLKRFKREARATSKLDHPNICMIYDISDFRGLPYMIMEFLKGRTLKHILAEGSLDLAKVVKYGTQVTSALQVAHENGIVHRDIKPANLFITDQDQLKILDFGLAKVKFWEQPNLGDTTTQLTPYGTMVGTLAYMSPEQASGHPVDHRSDLFSLGIVLYEMLTGQHPYDGYSSESIIEALLGKGRSPISVHKLQGPPLLIGVIDKLTVKHVERRYQSSKAVLADLKWVNP